jgi:hypothetical protein
VATQLTLARMAAMNRNGSVDVTLSTQVDQNNVPIRVSISAVKASNNASVFNQPAPLNGTSVLGGAVTVSFSSLGMRTSSGGTGVQTVAICNAKKMQYTVTIIPLGKVNWSPTSSTTPCP